MMKKNETKKGTKLYKEDGKGSKEFKKMMTKEME